MGGLGFVVANPANATTDCTGGTVTAMPGANNFSLAGGSLAGGAAATTCTVAVDVQSPRRPGRRAPTPTRSPPTRSRRREGFTNAAATANLVIAPATSVTINKSFNADDGGRRRHVGDVDPDPQQQRECHRAHGRRPHRHAAVGHGGRQSAGAHPRANCGAPTITAVNNTGTVTIANASIAVNAICTVNVTVRGNASGNLINMIPPSAVSSLQGVTNPLLGAATLAATGTVNLNVTKTNGQSSLTPGGTTTYTIGVTNAGPNDVAGMVVIDNPPAGVTFGAWTCVGGGRRHLRLGHRTDQRHRHDSRTAARSRTPCRPASRSTRRARSSTR